ncbi:hypothetical protein FBY33_2837 [Arthrobacter sp. SLBN-112]|uniref:DUF6262 family protein n=1 Tax=Arthrobacter sp. SLBN-112 TaxID=2768452 RepID=UPI0011518115|nr:DUF6262 family protein [Arthrobacter sp. SLBN-112]TQJ40751.1 hypothetical protein FBY33_2837 [Arthrobacter sp. SLBN-112]
MRADNSRHIRLAAERRHELTRSKAVAALRDFQNQGGPVTFEAVAAAAGVSRSWLYTQPDLRAVIIGLRADDRPQQPRARRSSASTDSLRARLSASLERNRELSTEIEHLRHQLALALGHSRSRNTSGP